MHGLSHTAFLKHSLEVTFRLFRKSRESSLYDVSNLFKGKEHRNFTQY